MISIVKNNSALSSLIDAIDNTRELISFGSGFTRRNHLWTVWKELLLRKMGTHQYEETATEYILWFYDEPEVHTCTIWKATVPDSIITVYSQEQNNADLIEFESVFKITANQRLTIKTLDGRQAFLPVLFPAGVFVNIIGAGDNTGYGDGQAFTMTSVIGEDKSVEFSFKDWVYVAGGKVSFSNAVSDDYIDFYFYAPATTVTPNQNNTGNCNIVSSVMIVPANGDGTHDIDYATAVPIPIGTEESYPNGYWDWSSPDTGKGVVIPVNGDGYYSLYTIPIDLCRLVTKMHILGSGSHDLVIPAVKPKKMLPHWKGKFLVHNSTLKTLNVVWYLVTGRAKTC